MMKTQNTHSTGKPILDALINASESFADKTASAGQNRDVLNLELIGARLERGEMRKQRDKLLAQLKLANIDAANLLAERNDLKNEVSNLQHDYAIVSAQRNELLAACKEAFHAMDELWHLAIDKANELVIPSEQVEKAYDAVRAAIANAEDK